MIDLNNKKPISTTHNIEYIPGINIVETFITDDLPPPELCATSFYIIFYKDKLILANNLRRGMEISGGHIEKGETIHNAALREAREETGFFDIKYIGHFVRRHTSNTEMPEGYKYPHPISYMTFFIGIAENYDFDLIIEDECDTPIQIPLGDYGYNVPNELRDDWNKFVEKHAIKEMLKYSFDLYCLSKKQVLY